MSRLVTPLMQYLPALRTPIVLGPMANAAGGLLCGAVSRAGAFGFIGAGYYTPEVLDRELKLAYSHLGLPVVLARDTRAEFGVGFLCWRLAVLNGGVLPGVQEAAERRSDAHTLIDVALRAKPRAIWLSFGADDEMRSWARVIREREAELNGPGDALKLFVMVGTEEELAPAVEQCGADVVVVQGTEAGGHGRADAPPLSALLPLVVAQLPRLSPNNPRGTQPLLLGAGGLSTGATLAAVLALGGAGGVLGTRFLLTPEAGYAPAQKAALVHARGGDTGRSVAFDEARGTTGWPARVDGRGVVNTTVREFVEARDAGPEAVRRRMERYRQADLEGDIDRIVTWAGTGVGSMHDILPAEEVVKQITQETLEALARVGRWVHIASPEL